MQYVTSIQPVLWNFSPTSPLNEMTPGDNIIFLSKNWYNGESFYTLVVVCGWGWGVTYVIGCCNTTILGHNVMTCDHSAMGVGRGRKVLLHMKPCRKTTKTMFFIPLPRRKWPQTQATRIASSLCLQHRKATFILQLQEIPCNGSKCANKYLLHYHK